MNDREATRRRIEAAVSELVPVRPYGPGRLALAWLLAGAVIAALGMLLVQPFRPHALVDLFRFPGFGVESLLGLFALLACARAAMAQAVPDGRRGVPWTGVAIGAVLAWIGWLCGTLLVPSTPPTMEGKRDLCFAEVFAWSLPLALAAAALQRRGLPLAPKRAAMLAGLAAGLVPAWLMQFACMHLPAHGLTHHVLPALVAPFATLALAAWIGGRARGRGRARQ